jgi:hypothetical protein
MNKLLSAKCSANVEKDTLGSHQSFREQVGSSTIKNYLRDVCVNILRKFGIIKLQSIYEKFEKAFDQMTLTPDELIKLNEEMA